MLHLTALQRARLAFQPEIPLALSDITKVGFTEGEPVSYQKELEGQFRTFQRENSLLLVRHQPRVTH